MSVFVAPSIWRDINVVTSVRITAAMLNAPTDEKVIYAPMWNDALLGRSRSVLTTEFLKTDADVMVIIDEDIVWDEPSEFWKIVEGCRDTRSIYGGMYVTRSVVPSLTSRVFPDSEVRFEETPLRRPLEIQYLATGFFALHRDVVEAMIGHRFEDADGGHVMAECTMGADRPFYPFFSPFQCIEEDGRRDYLSEDWAFCNRARQLGFKVWGDLSIKLKHMGLYPYSYEDLYNPGAQFPMRQQEWFSIQAGPRPFGEPIIDNLIEDIAEWSGDEVGDTRRMLEVSKDTADFLWNHRPLLETEAEFYRRDDVGYAYIGDLAAWHLKGAIPPLTVLPELKGRRLLDFGCGIGTWALIAAKNGVQVTCYEPNGIMREFLGWRAAKYGLEVEILADEPQGRSFDAINCFHVFEHLEAPEATLDSLLDMLSGTGVLVTDSGFDDHETASHHSHEDWGAVLASRHLVADDPCVYRFVRAEAAA